MAKQRQEEKPPIEILTELVEADKRISFFRKAGTKSVYATFSYDNTEYTTSIWDPFFVSYLMVIYNESTKKTLSKICIESFQSQMNSNCMFRSSKVELSVFKRIGVDENGTYYYKLRDNRFVEYGKSGYKIINKSPVKFLYDEKLLDQVDPDFSCEYEEIFNIIYDNFNISSDEEVDILVAWIVYCFIIDSSFQKVKHQILLITGRQGSGKTTAIEHINQIISPKNNFLYTISGEENLVTTLSNNYLTSFDNIRKINTNLQDHLCRACIGGTYPKRGVYTNNAMVEIDYKSIVVINGISDSLASNSDFLERVLHISLDCISAESRKSDTEILETFNNDLPKLLGIIFKLIPEVLKEMDNVKLVKAPRFKEFSIFGKALFNIIAPEIDFMDSLWKVIGQTKQIAIEGDIIIETLVLYMEEYDFKGTASELVFALEDYANDNNIILPRNIQPNKISELLNQYEGALEDEGITIEKKRSNGKRIIELYKEENTND